MKYIRKIRNGLFGFSVLLIALGLFLVVEPAVSSSIICYMFGALIILCGIIDLVNYKVNKKDRAYYRFDLIKGIVLFALGLFIVIKPGFVGAILPTIFGLVLLFDGITKILSSFDMKTGGTKNWIPIMAFGFLMCVLGIVIIINPFTLVNLSMIVIGVSLICDGISNIWCNVCLKKHIEENGNP
ncbi:MAG: DUF308 domain-containing protein [Oscillospiraceae bacterium]